MSYPLSLYGKTAVALSALGVAAYQDIKRREVNDAVWMLSIPAALSISACEAGLGIIDPFLLASSLALALFMGLLLYRFGLYGGADVKALLLIASAYPSYPPDTSLPLWRFFPLPLLAVIAAATLLSAAYPISILISNLMLMARGDNPLKGIEEENPFKRILLLMTARKIPIEELKGSLKHFPAERIHVENGIPKRKPLLFIHAEADIDRMVEELMKHKELYGDGVLASPTIPMVAFLEAACILLSFIILL